MHIEKNVFDIVFYTVLDVKGKIKDTENACRDLKLLCRHNDLHLIEHVNGKTEMTKGKYTLNKNQIKTVYKWVSNLKFPDRYASNISKLVDLKKYTFKEIKSHDCHVFIERLLPLTFTGLLPKLIIDVLTNLSKFFKAICSSKLSI